MAGHNTLCNIATVQEAAAGLPGQTARSVASCLPAFHTCRYKPTAAQPWQRRRRPPRLSAATHSTRRAPAAPLRMIARRSRTSNSSSAACVSRFFAVASIVHFACCRQDQGRSHAICACSRVELPHIAPGLLGPLSPPSTGTGAAQIANPTSL